VDQALENRNLSKLAIARQTVFLDLGNALPPEPVTVPANVSQVRVVAQNDTEESAPLELLIPGLCERDPELLLQNPDEFVTRLYVESGGNPTDPIAAVTNNEKDATAVASAAIVLLTQLIGGAR
jgi:hypothetical protein